ncbi:MAG: DUF3536 domain-containing protein [Elusimicrobia bacterium]|nr:DUF3536 domain-containing protein [Elusimicrobiota bacterium]
MIGQRCVCVHGHFYQPPRENPWLEDIEVQDSAHPYHDWNERITRECYAPNAASRVLDAEGRLVELIDNYRRISFNFGPTLLSWMERHAPEAYEGLRAADRASVRERSGHGNAWAQVYNHAILPLASRRDKETQVAWGIHDFVWRFGRKPEGMWLAETAVDTETLNVLIEHGIRFTLLSPQQARAVRPARRSADANEGAESAWRDVSGGRIDPSRPYLWRSPAGGSIVLFFYDAPISRAVAFEGILNNGETFAARLTDGFSNDRQEPQLVHIATDGESYGHHHRFGDMALAYALQKLEQDRRLSLTNYGEFLDHHPPTWEVEIHEASSWSCPHGVERWRSNCGCRMGSHAHWNQEWRTPLRDSLNHLAEDIDRLFETRGADFFLDPWRARNAYIDVILHRAPETLDAFWKSQARRPLSPAERTDALKLLEMERHRLLMFTSCAWFFDEISGLESTTVLLSTARALQLAAGFPGGAGLEESFLLQLAKAKSNIAEFGNGREIYRRFVQPVVTDLPRMAAHQALRTANGAAEGGRVYAYDFDLSGQRTDRSGGKTLTTGILSVRSRVTEERYAADYAVLHLGGHDFRCLLRPGGDAGSFDPLRQTFADRFNKQGGDDFFDEMRPHFGPHVYTLQDLLLEERRRMLSTVIERILGEFDGAHRRLVTENRALIDYLQKADHPMPHAFRLALESVLGRDLSAALAGFTGEASTAEPLRRVRRDAAAFHVQLQWSSVTQELECHFLGRIRALVQSQKSEDADKALFLLDFAEELDLSATLWEAENLFFTLWKKPATDRRALAALARRLRFAD